MLRRFLLPGLLLLMLLGTGWLAWLQPDEALDPIHRQGLTPPDYILSGLQLRQYDDQGKLIRELKAARLAYIKDQGTALDLPQLTLHNAVGSPWVITGAKGLVDASGQQLLMPEDALINRMASPDNRGVRLVTRNLSYQLDQGYAQTDEAVTVTSDRDRIDAVGLDAWLQDPSRIHFRSQVRGHYVP